MTDAPTPEAAEIIEMALDAYFNLLEDPAHADTSEMADSVLAQLTRAGIFIGLQQDQQVDKGEHTFDATVVDGTGGHAQLVLGNLQTAKHYLEMALVAADRVEEVEEVIDPHTDRQLSAVLIDIMQTMGATSQLVLRFKRSYGIPIKTATLKAARRKLGRRG